MARLAFVAVASMAAMAIALPLNINLGAYSPALVVGDGEISFGGSEDVSSLMSVLEGAAVNAASDVAKNAGSVTTVTNAAKAAGPSSSAVPASTDAEATVVDEAALEQAQQIAKLKGLGKEISPRAQLKRDLSGFDRALTFAEAALTKGPKIQLGTGVEGSGVGIIVDNNQVAAARPGKGASDVETAVARRRDVAAEVSGSGAPKQVRAKVTTMYVRSGVPTSLQSRNRVVEVPAAPASVSRRDAVDEVNLNVDGNQDLTMTFVETVELEDDE